MHNKGLDQNLNNTCVTIDEEITEDVVDTFRENKDESSLRVGINFGTLVSAAAGNPVGMLAVVGMVASNGFGERNSRHHSVRPSAAPVTNLSGNASINAAQQRHISHELVEEHSETANTFGQLLRLASAGFSFGMAAMELYGQAQQLMAGPQAPSAHEDHRQMRAQEYVDEPLSPEDQRVADAIESELRMADRELARAETRRARPIPAASSDSVPSGASVETYHAIYTRAAAGQIAPEIIEQAAILDYHAHQLDELAAQHPHSAAVQDRYEIARGEIQAKLQNLQAQVLAAIPESHRKHATEVFNNPDFIAHYEKASTPEGQRRLMIEAGVDVAAMLIPGKFFTAPIKALGRPAAAALRAVGGEPLLAAGGRLAAAGANLAESFLAKIGMGGGAQVARGAGGAAVRNAEGKGLASTSGNVPANFGQTPGLNYEGVWEAMRHPALPKDTPMSAWRPAQQALDKIPQGLVGTGAAANKNPGFKWLDRHGSNHIRIDKGNPVADFPHQQVDHVRINLNGKVIGRDGNPIITETISGLKPRANPEAHIPLSEWVNWSEWFKP